MFIEYVISMINDDPININGWLWVNCHENINDNYTSNDSYL